MNIISTFGKKVHGSVQSLAHSNGTVQALTQTGTSQGRKMSTKCGEVEKVKKVVFVTGATGEMGGGLIEKGLSNNYNVVAFTRKIKDNAVNTPSFKWKESPENKLTYPEFWAEQVRNELDENKYNEVLFVNTVGGAVPPKGKTLEDINTKPLIAMADGMSQIANERKDLKVNFGHVSSIAASILGKNHPYGNVKKEVDERLVNDYAKLKPVVLRPGLIFNDMQVGNYVDLKHAYSPEQLATLPFQPVFGKGEQIMQPVYSGDMNDALFRGAEINEHGIFDAVGPEEMTTLEMLEFFRNLRGKKVRNLHLGYDIGHFAAKYFPKGRIAPYAVALFEELEKCNRSFDKAPFENLVGKPLTSLQEAYQPVEDQPIVFAKPPIVSHLKEIITVLGENSEARSELLQILRKHGLDIAKQIIFPNS
jgi:nucleoside-diphosphate-sugar epimerase